MADRCRFGGPRRCPEDQVEGSRFCVEHAMVLAAVRVDLEDEMETIKDKRRMRAEAIQDDDLYEEEVEGA